MITREQAKALFRDDVDAYGKPHKIMSKIDMIYDGFLEKINDYSILEIRSMYEALKDQRIGTIKECIEAIEGMEAIHYDRQDSINTLTNLLTEAINN